MQPGHPCDGCWGDGGMLGGKGVTVLRFPLPLAGLGAERRMGKLSAWVGEEGRRGGWVIAMLGMCGSSQAAACI